MRGAVGGASNRVRAVTFCLQLNMRSLRRAMLGVCIRGGIFCHEVVIVEKKMSATFDQKIEACEIAQDLGWRVTK